jgi:hypothetical protein
VSHQSPHHSAKRRRSLLLVYLAATLIFSLDALAQSGRRPKVTASPSPPPVIAEAKPEPETPVLISSVIVVGDLIQPGVSSWSNDVDTAVDACVKRLKELQVMDALGSGSRTKEVAIKMAKKETNAYVLWLGIRKKEKNMWGDMTVPYIDYIVFMPVTAKVLFEGRVDPNKREVVRIGGVRVPSDNRGPLDEDEQLEEGGRKVADQVRRKLRVTWPE